MTDETMSEPLTALPKCMTCGAVAFDPMAGACGECGAEDRWIGSQWLNVPADNLPLDAARQPTVDVPRVFRCDFDCDACRATADHYGIALAAQETPE